MSIDRKTIKREAKLAMHEAKPSPVLVTLVLVAIVAVLQVLSMSLNGDIEAIRTMVEAAMAGEESFIEPAGATGFGWVLTLAIEIMAMVLNVGYSLYCLRISRRIKAGVGDMFDGFGLFVRAICISIMPSLLVSAWSMLYALPVSFIAVGTGAYWVFLAGLPLLIPAYMAAYSYRQSTFILLDNPQLNWAQCINLSKAVMQGHKWELFVLDLTFLGWQLLCVVPFVGLWVTPYMNTTMANYYSAVMGDFAVRTGHVPHYEENADADVSREDDTQP